MSELVPSVLPLDKGLDLQTAKIIAPPGSVLDTLNYEQVDFQGQKRIEGYTRYDGSVLSAVDEYYVLTVADGTGISAGDMLVKDELVFGIVADNPADLGALYYLRTNAAIDIDEADSITIVTPDGSENGYTVISNVPGKEVDTTPETHYDRLLDLMERIRVRVENLPGGIIGLHWFQDRLYAVADTAYIKISSATTVYPNDVLTINGTDYNVFDVYAQPGSQTVLLQATNQDFEGATVERNGDPLGTAEVGEYPTDLDRLATIFESRNEQQVLNEDSIGSMDFGWRAKHLGWLVNYEDGKVLYGSLAALNQNRQNVGIEGPTSTAGVNGSPAVLFQKIALTNGPAQVNGWKSSDTPTNYVLDATDVQQIDSKYTYADAFVSWTADSSVVSTPGSDMVGMVEYSPTSTIRFTDLP